MRERITLCIIAGNVERYIERFIHSFAPLVGKIVIVQAIGAQRCDDTLFLASAAAINAGIEFEADIYVNEPGKRTLPHVDDFAAARNLAFSLADTEWIAWADTDDLLAPGSAELIHATLQKHGNDLDGLTFDYHVPEDGLTVLKERIIRRGSGQWRYPIHEEFVFSAPNPPLLRVPGAAIHHAPIGDRKANDARNLTLLESMGDSMPTGHRFHYVNTLRAVGRFVDSADQTAILLQDPQLGTPERYELLMVAAQTATDIKTSGQLFLQALATDPGRREAYGELAMHAFRTLQFPRALSWTRAMRAIPRPPHYLWNARSKYYGWAGEQLHAWALRAHGDMAGADAHEFNHFSAHGARISLLHATRGRPKQAYQAKFRWLDSAANPDAIEHIFAIDADDDPSRFLCIQRHVMVQPGGGCVRAWNAAAAVSRGHVLIQLSDDWNPPQRWDEKILERLGDLSAPSVLSVSDGHRTDDLLCMAILTRARYLQQGYLFHPDFLSVYSDNWFTHCAYRDRAVIEAKDLIFEHAHPAFDSTIPMDQTYAESNTQQRYAHGKAVFDRLLDESDESPVEAP